MLPRLYDFSTDISDYTHNGYGFFTKIVQNGVKMVLNGEYTLSMSILSTDRLAEKVAPDMCILAKPNYNDNPQIFIIDTIKVNNSGTVDITAKHIKYLFFNNMILGENDSAGRSYTGTPTQIYNAIKNSLVLPYNTFNFHSNITSSKTVVLGDNEETLGSIFDNDRDGLIKVFGGELWFDNFNVHFDDRIGNTVASQVVRYGTNISSYEQTMSGVTEYTHILPFANVNTQKDYSEDLSSVKLYGLINNTTLIPTGSTSSFARILTLDFSNKFKSKSWYVDPSAGNANGYQAVRDELVRLGQDYVDRHTSMASPSVSVTVDYESAIDKFNKVALGDTVKVIYDPIDYAKNHRVTETTFDFVNERYSSVKIGNRKYSLYDFIKGVK